MATTISKTFAAVGFGNGLAIKNGDKFTYSVSGTFVGTVRLTESIDGGASWSPTGVSATGSASGTYFAKLRSASSALYRWECTAYTSGAIVTSLVDADIHLQEWYSNDGILAGYVDETGFNGGTLVSGAGFADGLVGTPSFAYVLDTDTGFYRIGDGNFAATCNGTKSAEFKSSGILVPDGSSSAPSYSFTSEPTAGLFRDAAGSCEWVSADTSNTRFRVDSTSLTANAGFLASTASGSSGDAYIRFIEISSASDQWIMGRDDSASGAFKLSQGAALGTNDFLSCTTAGAWTIGASGSTAAHSFNGTSIGLQASGANNPSLNLFAATGQNRNGVISIRGTNTGGASLQSSYTTSFYDGTTNRTIGEIDIYSTSAVGSTSGGQMKFVTSKTDGTQVFAMVIDENQVITLGASGSSAQHVLNGRFLDLQASSPGVAGLLITNANNAAAGAHAEVELNVGGTSGGDPYIRMNISGGQGWSAGVDNSDGDKYKVSASTAVGTNDYLTIDPTGLGYMPGGLLAGGGASSRLFTESGVESWINSTSGTTRQSMALYARNVSTGNTAQGTNYFDAGAFLTLTRQTSANTSENTSFLAAAVVQLDFNTANSTTYTNTGNADTLICRAPSQSNTGAVAITSLNTIRFEDNTTSVGTGVTRKNHILFGTVTSATNNCFITDSTAYTGNYGINLQTAYHHTFLAPICSQRLDVASAATITALSSAQGFIKLTGSTATALQGITAGKDGQRLTLVNLTGANLTVQNENAGATAANRITTMTGADVVTTGNGAAQFVYDTGSSRWICLYVTA